MKTLILEKETVDWFRFCSMRVAQACLENISSYQFRSIVDHYPDLISRLYAQIRLSRNSRINGGVPWPTTYKTQTYEQLTCGSSNVVYAIYCVRCGLMYVGEIGRSLRSRINGHRAGIIKDGQSLLYKHFRLAGHSVADMKVQILEKIYHSSENPVNIRLHRRLRELHWIKELGTAAPYGCNDQIKGVGTLSSPSCKHTNVLGIFNKQQR